MKYILFDTNEAANLRNEQLLTDGISQGFFSGALKFCTILENVAGDKFAIPYMPPYQALYTNVEKAIAAELPSTWYTDSIVEGVDVIVNMTVVPSTVDISKQDYNILGYHKKRTFLKGELVSTEYYAQFDELTKVYDNLRVKETNQYIKQDGFVVKRTKLIEWFVNGVSAFSKTTHKFYSVQESINEGITRRNNVMADLKAKAWFLLGDANSYDLLFTLKQEIELYINAHVAPLLTALGTLDREYLDAFLPETEIPVRMYFISELTP